MNGYIANTDRVWFNFILNNGINNPVFWFNRVNNPNQQYLVVNNYIFLRITDLPPKSVPVLHIVFLLKHWLLLEVILPPVPEAKNLMSYVV